MSTVIYLHGFASVGLNPKSQTLIDQLPNSTVLTPDLSIDPYEVVTQVIGLAKNAKSLPLVFVGTSLGGFWANYFAQKFNAPCVLVNPAMVPSRNMYEYVGHEMKNYVTNEPIKVTMEHIKRFNECERDIVNNVNSELIYVFSAKDDDVVPTSEVAYNIPYSKEFIVTDVGGHRFESNWQMVIDKVKSLV